MIIKLISQAHDLFRIFSSPYNTLKINTYDFIVFSCFSFCLVFVTSNVNRTLSISVDVWLERLIVEFEGIKKSVCVK